MRTVFTGLAVGLLSAIIVLVLDPVCARLPGARGSRPIEALEWRTYDWRLTRTADPRAARRDLALVDIDEYSLRNLQPNAGRWPWPRAVHSMVIDFLARGPARVVAYDVNFAEADTRSGFPFGGTTWSGEESDQALVDSVRKAGNVLLPIDATFEGGAVAQPQIPDQGFRVDRSIALKREAVFPPFPALAAAAAGFGHTLLVLDPDGPIRHTVPFVAAGPIAVPSLGLAAALRLANIPAERVRRDGDDLAVGEARMPLSARVVQSANGPLSYHWGLIRFHGPAQIPGTDRPLYQRYPFFDLLVAEEQLLAGEKPQVDPAVFKDKAVFVGITASGLFDVFETPFAQGKMPGTQVHAAVADDVSSRRFVRIGSSAIRLITIVASAVAAGLLTSSMPIWGAVGGTGAVIAVLWWGLTRAFGGGYWLPLAAPTISALLALFVGVTYYYVVEGREKRRIKRLFGQYVSPDVFAQLLEHPEQARLGGQRRLMTVLFCDIRDFTTLSEQGTPEQIVAMLNEYFTCMVGVVLRHRGTVDKFVGDMVMALFGAPLDDPAHAQHAVDAALDMIAELHELNAKWAAEGRLLELHIGVGINTGPMIAGNIGSETIMSYTVIGDAVNLGSRLQSLNKQFDTCLLISQETRAALPTRYIVKPLGAVAVKGKSEPVAVFEVVGRTDTGVHPAREGQQ